MGNDIDGDLESRDLGIDALGLCGGTWLVGDQRNKKDPAEMKENVAGFVKVWRGWERRERHEKCNGRKVKGGGKCLICIV